jgi:hypothetical protein
MILMQERTKHGPEAPCHDKVAGEINVEGPPEIAGKACKIFLCKEPLQ